MITSRERRFPLDRTPPSIPIDHLNMRCTETPPTATSFGAIFRATENGCAPYDHLISRVRTRDCAAMCECYFFTADANGLTMAKWKTGFPVPVKLGQRVQAPLEAIDRSVQEFGRTLNALGCDLFADGLNLALRNDSVQNGVKKQVSEVRIVPKNSTPTEPTNTDTRRPTNVTNDRALGSNVRIEVSSDGESFSIGAGMRNPSNPPVGMAANAVPESNGAPPK
uniref:Uncharacterized protein n=1 Tax=Anopheles coluzzii TaxID=1518534 RepID=A0A8W7PKD1_ANOCL